MSKQKLQLHRVLRPLCIGGQRVEVGALVELGPVLGAELRAAAKVARCTEEEAAELQAQAEAQAKDREPVKQVEPAARVRKAAKPAEAAGTESTGEPPADPPADTAQPAA